MGNAIEAILMGFSRLNWRILMWMVSCNAANDTTYLLKENSGERIISLVGPPRLYVLTALDNDLQGYMKPIFYADKPQMSVFSTIPKVAENWASRLEPATAITGLKSFLKQKSQIPGHNSKL